MGNHFAAEVSLEHEVYYPGNVVRGEATIKIDKPMSCIAARIMCRGLERAVVVRQTGEYVHSVNEDTVFFKDTLTLFGHPTKDADATPVEVPPGVYTYPFAFQLPMHLPESLHTAHWQDGGAEVKYQVITYAKLEENLVDEGHHDFTVVVPINKRDVLASPAVEAAGTAKLTRFFMDKGSCDFKVSLPRSLYAADDVIEGEVSIDNTNGQIDVDHPKVGLRSQCDVFVSERCSGVPGGMRGCSLDKAIASKKLIAIVANGKSKVVPFKISLPHTLLNTSYPARGCNVQLSHVLTVELAGKRIQVPIHVAHCADEQNRFAFCPLGDVTHKPDYKDTEHAYVAPAGYVASPCEAMQPPASLKPQGTPEALTPQAVGNGQMHASH